MKPEQQRIKIAEACGYKYSESCGWFDKDGETYYLGNEDIDLPQIPDYLYNLNAMQSAENRCLTSDLAPIYNEILTELCLYVGWWETRATAELRAKALLKTLGLWEE
jgi:hypothetical protein